MGLCVSSPAMITNQEEGRTLLNLPQAAQVIHWDGKLQGLWLPTGAGEVLNRNPNFFLCSLETINVDSLPRPLAKDEALQLGQLYFLLPVSKIAVPFSLKDLCALAVKANKALKCDSDIGLGCGLTQTSSVINVRPGPIFLDRQQQSYV